MKSYLSLITISARAHKRQNRMTRLCIIAAVFMVTAIFGMADMGVRMESSRLAQKHGMEAVQSLKDSAAAQTLYTAAGILFVLVLIAGVLMISNSINSNVAQRTKFFGMMRCIGMSKKQIVRFVRLEALNWCKTAVPAGVILGTIVTWILCAVLRYGIGGEFSEMPVFQMSPIGIICGGVIGIVTVLLAARHPAKRAAKVSPVAAVSGNANDSSAAKKPVKLHFGKIDVSLGIHHASAAKKNLVLMTSSFALSIILFLCFHVLIELVGYMMPQTTNWSDLGISCEEENTIAYTLPEEIRTMEGVKQVFSRRNCLDLPAKVKENSISVDLISYDDFDLACLKKDHMLKKGSDLDKIYGDTGYALAVWDPKNPLAIGDTIDINNQSIQIAGFLKYNPFTDDGSSDGKLTLITSGETFVTVTGISDYSLVMIQLTKDAADENVMAIHDMLSAGEIFTDKRDVGTASTYFAFVLFVYGFLIIIALVTVLNIMNSISMSVSARTKQYGAMRAVGMDLHQMTRMIAAEALTYSVSGCIVGIISGLFLSRRLFSILITAHFSYAVWSVPVMPLVVVVLIVFLTSGFAIYEPARRMQRMEIIEVLNEL